MANWLETVGGVFTGLANKITNKAVNNALAADAAKRRKQWQMVAAVAVVVVLVFVAIRYYKAKK